MTARLNTAMGRHWGGLVRAIDIIYLIGAFGALGGLPPLIDVLTKYAHDVMRSLRRLGPGIAHLILMAGVLGLLTLQGCAPVVLKSPTTTPEEVAADSPGGLRVMGADHRFAEISLQSAARRAHHGSAGEPFSILAIPVAYPKLAPFDFRTSTLQPLFPLRL